jgi:FlaA1/EpsC-like NDP-sugar epimerase
MVLDMGEQLKVLDVARHLIRLSGHVPDEDMQIVFTGLRPGEKLYEELQGNAEVCEPSGIEKIIRIRRRSLPDWPRVERQILELIRLARRGRPPQVLQKLRDIVPTYECAPVECEELVDGRVLVPLVR